MSAKQCVVNEESEILARAITTIAKREVDDPEKVKIRLLNEEREELAFFCVGNGDRKYLNVFARWSWGHINKHQYKLVAEHTAFISGLEQLQRLERLDITCFPNLAPLKQWLNVVDTQLQLIQFDENCKKLEIEFESMKNEREPVVSSVDEDATSDVSESDTEDDNEVVVSTTPVQHTKISLVDAHGDQVSIFEFDVNAMDVGPFKCKDAARVAQIRGLEALSRLTTLDCRSLVNLELITEWLWCGRFQKLTSVKLPKSATPVEMKGVDPETLAHSLKHRPMMKSASPPKSSTAPTIRSKRTKYQIKSRGKVLPDSPLKKVKKKRILIPDGFQSSRAYQDDIYHLTTHRGDGGKMLFTVVKESSRESQTSKSMLKALKQLLPGQKYSQSAEWFFGLVSNEMRRLYDVELERRDSEPDVAAPAVSVPRGGQVKSEADDANATQLREPQQTLRVLNQLKSHGFTNKQFQQLHHIGRSDNMKKHEQYCRRVGYFVDENNSLVLKRLDHILDLYNKASVSDQAFDTLIEKTLAKFPLDSTTSSSPAKPSAASSSTSSTVGSKIESSSSSDVDKPSETPSSQASEDGEMIEMRLFGDPDTDHQTVRVRADTEKLDFAQFADLIECDKVKILDDLEDLKSLVELDLRALPNICPVVDWIDFRHLPRLARLQAPAAALPPSSRHLGSAELVAELRKLAQIALEDVNGAWLCYDNYIWLYTFDPLATSSFPPDDWADSQAREVRHVRGLAQLPHLTQLDLTVAPNLEPLSQWFRIQHFPKLLSLKVPKKALPKRMQKMSPQEVAQALRDEADDIVISGYEVPPGGMSCAIQHRVKWNAQELDLGSRKSTHWTRIDNISQLKFLQRLLLGNNRFSSTIDIKNIGLCKSLVVLDLSSNDLTCIEQLEPLIQLKHLALQENKLENITPIAKLTQLEWLNVASNNIKDARPLAASIDLEELNLSANPVGSEPQWIKETLAPLQCLRHLNISATTLRSAVCVRPLKKLETLRMNCNKIESLQVLKNHKKLYLLWVSENRIKHISALAGLVEMKDLRVGDNRLLSISSLSSLKKMEVLEVNNNQLASLQGTETMYNLVRLAAGGNMSRLTFDVAKHSLKHMTSLATLQIDSCILPDGVNALSSSATPAQIEEFAKKIVRLAKGEVVAPPEAPSIIEQPPTPAPPSIIEQPHSQSPRGLALCVYMKNTPNEDVLLDVEDEAKTIANYVNQTGGSAKVLADPKGRAFDAAINVMLKQLKRPNHGFQYILVMFSGHGSFDEIVLYDTTRKISEIEEKFADDEVRTNTNDTVKVFIWDACRGGTAGNIRSSAHTAHGMVDYLAAYSTSALRYAYSGGLADRFGKELQNATVNRQLMRMLLSSCTPFYVGAELISPEGVVKPGFRTPQLME
eukprot:CAMPEP_0168600842 /NCGR_PEP_ID=MMETSP0420-20121227/13051_1 /TAXON_ID=498008 /ORGANISM="Pessonella sp." /LENGTH=1391 /DNA_ID=CAMNT_0008639063 /DNA_START=12 /DNA_END=4184 /DNA_ORIENTATION=+